MSATPCLSLLYGMETASWYAWLALRRRVSMSAIGSVIVMAARPFLHRGFAPASQVRPAAIVVRSGSVIEEVAQQPSRNRSPRGLGHAGQLAAVRHLPQADPAQAELAVDGLGPAATLAAGVATHRELGLAGRLDSQSCLRHVLIPSQRSAKGNPSCLSSARPSSSLVAVVTTVMSMPRVRSMRSWSTSWNMT